MTKTIIYGSIDDLGDGTATIRWFISEKQAYWHIQQMEGSMLEEPIEVETFLSSVTHLEAVKTSASYMKEYEESDFYYMTE